LGVHHLVLQYGLEEGRHGEDILVRCKDSLLLTDNKCDDGRDGVPDGDSSAKLQGIHVWPWITYSAGKSTFMVLEVAGRRRVDSWRRFEIPASLLNDEFDLPIRPLLEKLLC
jgi:hypothetical protein